MEKCVLFKIENGFSSYQKWKENRLDPSLEETAIERLEKSNEQVKQIFTIFDPYLKEILTQFSQKQ